MQDRLDALRELIRLPQQNPQAVGVAIAIVVLLAIVLVLLLIAIALPGRRAKTPVPEPEPEEASADLGFLARLAHRRRLAKRWESILVTLTILAIGLLAAGATWYHTTSSNEYCTRTCHAMSKPADNWRFSSHAEIDCVRCHEGPPWVSMPTALVARSRSLYYELTETSATPRPVPEEACLQCHEGLKTQTIVGRNGGLFTHGMVMSRERTCKTCHGAQGHVIPRTEEGR